jgi:hypothetical protein
VTAHFAPEDPVRGLPKFLIDKGKEAIQGFPVTTSQLVEELRNFA